MIPDLFKTPLPPQELTILRYLQNRMSLPSNLNARLEQLTKGYMGEKKFYELLKEQLPSNFIILNNLLLEYNNSEFQIDSLVIFENKVLIFEVKNFEGEFFIRDDHWFTVKNENEIRNPFLQINRSEHLLRKLLQQLGRKFTVTSYLIFINNEFTLYKAPLNKNIILPTQLNRFINNISAISFKQMTKHRKLVKQLTSRNLNRSSHEQVLEYEFDSLRKGIICNDCHSFLVPLKRSYVKCKECGEKISVDSALLKSVAEFSLLFPYKKITTNAIHKWCKIIKSKKAVRRILAKHYTQINHGKHAYYIIQSS